MKIILRWDKPSEQTSIFYGHSPEWDSSWRLQDLQKQEFKQLIVKIVLVTSIAILFNPSLCSTVLIV